MRIFVLGVGKKLGLKIESTKREDGERSRPWEESEVTLWLDALVEQGFIEEWQGDLEVEPGQAAAVAYVIDGRRYTPEGAIRLIRDIEVCQPVTAHA